MREVEIAGLRSSCIGFGCASLGSRVGAGEGLRALGRALDAGVTWFDVAPAYGGGEGEAILGRFLTGRREAVRVVTKVGLAPPRRGLAYRLLLPIARPLVAAVKGLRTTVKAMPGGANRRVAIDGAAIRASIDASLVRLGTDHVDVYALHMPEPAALARDDVRRALEDVIAAGKALAVAVAGDREAGIAAAGVGAPYAIVQIGDDPAHPPLPALRAAGARDFVTHSIFGVGGALAAIEARLASDPGRAAMVRAAGYEGPLRDAAAALLIDRALASNPGGVVLASMFKPHHLEANVARAVRPVHTAAATLVASLLD